jgi:hypothetical protein
VLDDEDDDALPPSRSAHVIGRPRLTVGLAVEPFAEEEGVGDAADEAACGEDILKCKW